MTKQEKQALADKVAEEYRDFIVRREVIKGEVEQMIALRLKSEREPLNRAIRDLLDAGGSRYLISKAVGNTNWHFITSLVEEATGAELPKREYVTAKDKAIEAKAKTVDEWVLIPTEYATKRVVKASGPNGEQFTAHYDKTEDAVVWYEGSNELSFEDELDLIPQDVAEAVRGEW